jgi:iron complex transport system substrate-binding protein
VDLQSEAVRIVSLVPHATELLFALGLGEQLVAVTHECDHPPQARERARATRDALPAGLSAREIDRAVRERTLAGEAIYELDREALAAAEPDLIVTQALCPVCAVSYEDVARLARELPTRPRVIALDPQTLPETHADVKTVAEATGRGARGAQLVAQAGARIDAVRAAVRALPRPRVLALEWLDPPYVAGHWTPQMIELAGGQDVAGRPGEPSYGASWEELQALGPEVVIVMPCGYDAARAHAEALEHLDSLAPLRAQRIVAVDASAYFSRPGPRLTEGVELLGHILHAESLPSPPSGSQALAVEPLTVRS